MEWFTVNRSARDQGQNGAIKRLFREISTVDKVGEKEGSGTPLNEPVIQHVEMGRDQAHGCGDLTNSAIMSRLMQAQGTKVDPDTGTVSTAFNAVDCFTYLDDRLINTSDFFFEYMLGYDADWVSVPFAIDTDGTIKDSYAAFAASYRGRYSTINFWDFLCDVGLYVFKVEFPQGEKVQHKSELFSKNGMHLNAVKDERHAIVSTTRQQFQMLKNRVRAYTANGANRTQFDYIESISPYIGTEKNSSELRKKIYINQPPETVDIQLMLIPNLQPQEYTKAISKIKEKRLFGRMNG